MARTNRTKSQGGDPYENLANAIILQAVSDYRMAKKSRNKRVEAEVLRFFRSKWFGVLTEVDPEYLIRRLDEEG
ncbi:MAG: hypothetical protein ACI4W2_00815 [Eubacterium sp.]